MEEDVQLLFAYARRGDVQSLAALVRRHATWMQALLRGMLPVAADVDDVFQETWMRVIRAAPCYRGGMVKPYLATVARSAAIDHLRRTRAVVSLDDEEGEGDSAADEGERDEPAIDDEDDDDYGSEYLHGKDRSSRAGKAAGKAAQAKQQAADQIGRASCRERVSPRV